MNKKFAPPYLFLLSVLLFSCNGKSKIENTASTDSLAMADTLVRNTKPEVYAFEKDTSLDYAARFIAGLSQEKQNSFSIKALMH